MKILCTSDWQAMLGNLDRCRLILNQMLEIIRREKIHNVIHLGDLKNVLNPVDVRVVNFLAGAVKEIIYSGARFIILRGNHDSITTQDNTPSLLPSLKAAGAEVVDKEVEEIPLGNGVFLYLVPYFRDSSLQRGAFKTAASLRTKPFEQPGLHILAFHNEVSGCKMGSTKGKAFSPGDLFAEDYDICIGGHIHQAQFLKPNIHYVGSPFCCDWSEANQDKSFLLLSISEAVKGKPRATLSTQIPSTVPGWYDPSLPNFQAPKSWEGTHVRFKVPVYKDPVVEIEEVRARVAPKYKGATLHLIPDFQKTAPVTGGIDIKGSDEDILREYLSKATLPENTNADQVITYLKDYLPKIGLFGVQGLKFKKVVASNVLCFEKVELDLDRKGLTLVTGRNLDWESDAGNISNGCVAKGAFIDCPRDLSKYPYGTPIEELVGKRPYVYCYDHKLKRIALRKASWVKKTGVAVPVVKIKFKEPFGDPTLQPRKNYRPQNKHGRRIPPQTELLLTAEHLVLQRNGEYKAAKDLQAGDRVMPLYRRNRDSGYWGIGLSNGKSWKGSKTRYLRGNSVIESRFILSELYGKRSTRFHAHHKNENWDDNSVNNLEWKDKSKHSSDHLRKRNLEKTTGWQKTGVHPRGMAGKHHTPKIKKQIAATMRLRHKKHPEIWRSNHLVVSVEPAGVSDVYDIHVPTVHNFVANSVVVHNSGKSSLVQLPFIPLFGRTFKGQSDDAWASQSNKFACGVSVTLKLPDGSELRIVRGRRPPNLRIYRDGKEISMGDKNTTQRMIEQITNLTWDVLTNSVYIGQREIGSVFGTEKDRKELFSRLLGLDRFLDAQEKIRKAVLRIQRVIDETAEELEATKRALLEASTGRGEIAKALAEVPEVDPKAIRKQDSTISELEAKIRSNEQEITDLDPALDKNQKDFEVWLDKETRADATTNELKKQKAAAEGLTGKSVCPTCGSKVSVAALEAKVDDLERKIQVWEAEIGKYEKFQQMNRTARQALLNRVQECRLENRKIQTELVSLRQQASKAKEQAEARQRLETILNQKERRVRELSRFQKVHEQALEAFKDEKRFVEFCANTVGRNGLPAYLCSIVAPHLNAAASRYSQIFAKGEINIEFEIANGDIDVHIRNLHGGKSIKDQSEGETRLAALIAAFSFRDVLVKHSILVLDEPANGLDPVNAVAFAQGLNSVVERFGHVMVIAHSSQLLGALEPDYHLEVVKQNGIATVREI